MCAEDRHGKAYRAKMSAERMRRRKLGLFKKAHTFSRDFDMDVAVIIHKNGRYYTYRSNDQQAWPPSMDMIVSNHCNATCIILTLPRMKHFQSLSIYSRGIWKRGFRGGPLLRI
jgi:hypothetical protein